MAVEQILNTSIGMINMIMVSHVGLEAVAAIGLVDSLNMVFFNLFTALATGIMVVVAQSMGRHDLQSAKDASAQAYSSSIAMAMLASVPLLLCGRFILELLFSGADTAVLEAAEIYLFASSLTYPFIAASQTGFGIVRARGDSRSPLICSVVGNLGNIIVSAVLIFGMNMGIVGSAVGMVVARVLSALLIAVPLWRLNDWHRLEGFTWHFTKDHMMPILRISIPSGTDNLMFNGGKLVLATFLSGMGTVAMAANGIINSLFGFIIVPGNSISVISVPVVGYYYGAQEYKQARFYMLRLTFFSFITSALVAAGMFFILPSLVALYNDDPLVQKTAIDVINYLLLMLPLFWTCAFVTPAAIRATGDVAFLTAVSMVSMWTLRVAGGWIIAVSMGYGVYGIWIAMTLDWIVRSVFYLHRAWSGKWLKLPNARELLGT
ncbi:MAG: MATE family efflux transporter [Symbiobacteriaceae bacterium]|nr:MATE family efflux transporter [Symbiobacteriaceae bacterium]